MSTQIKMRYTQQGAAKYCSNMNDLICAGDKREVKRA